jgi:hypothetical protein
VSSVETFGERMHTRGVCVQPLHVVMMRGMIMGRLLQSRVVFQQLRMFGGESGAFRFEFGIHAAIPVRCDALQVYSGAA